MNKQAPLIGFIAVTLLAACDNSRLVRDEDSQYYSVTPGATFALHNEVTIPPDQTSVYFQDGKLGASRDVDIYIPNCKFELYTISEKARVVNPDTFRVIRIVDQLEAVSIDTPTYAGLGMLSGDYPSHFTWVTMMYLESKIQPDVYRMSCMRWDWLVMGEYLSINEMRRALGDHFTLTLAD